MTLCRFFQQGNCNKGNSCTFEHVRPQWQASQGGGAMATSKYNESSIKLNLTEERPHWKLSVYAPAKEEPNLVVGTDLSCEEDRLLYYSSMRTTGNESQYNISHEHASNKMEMQVNAILNNPSAAIQHYEKEKQKHSGPFGGAANNSNAPFAPFTGSGAFGSSTTATAFGGGGSAFGQPSAFGTAATATKPAFGSTGFGSASAFGSTSALGAGGSAFGSTSALGSSAFGSTSALGSGFGSTSTLGGTSAFGQPSAFGTTANKPVSAFGASITTAPTSAFGSTSTLGRGAFGTNTAAPTFGSTSNLVGGGAFGSSALGNTTTAAIPTFGSTTAFGSTTTTPAFGAVATTAATNVPNTMATGNDAATSLDSTNAEYQAFVAPQFTYRAIPEIEPPIQLR